MSITVKDITSDKEKPKQIIKESVKATVKSSMKHGASAFTSFKGKGLVTLEDAKGNLFSVPEKEYVKYYSDETKFTVKKKAI
jgi:predicted oxidoreductase (fatty acid repression mutant protein)